MSKCSHAWSARCESQVPRAHTWREQYSVACFSSAAVTSSRYIHVQYCVDVDAYRNNHYQPKSIQSLCCPEYGCPDNTARCIRCQLLHEARPVASPGFLWNEAGGNWKQFIYLWIKDCVPAHLSNICVSRHTSLMFFIMMIIQAAVEDCALQCAPRDPSWCWWWQEGIHRLLINC